MNKTEKRLGIKWVISSPQRCCLEKSEICINGLRSGGRCDRRQDYDIGSGCVRHGRRGRHCGQVPGKGGNKHNND